jgi:hypothetical protein
MNTRPCRKLRDERVMTGARRQDLDRQLDATA